jgi:hypothetical protein
MENWLGYILLMGLGVLAVRVLIKSAVEKSVSHVFDVKLERLKQDFERGQETRERRDKFRLAALDKRLEVHQRAFTLARKMINTLLSSKPEIRNDVSSQCKQFWEEQSLYLSNEVRKQFRKSLLFYNYYLEDGGQIASLKDDDPETYKKEKERFLAEKEQFMSLPALIERAVDLEAMGNEQMPNEEI